MAAPTQAYPPWLTPVPSVVTDAAGEPTTSTSIEYLPLTYYGPSIPLGTLWVYGGSLSPVFSITTLASTTITATIAPTTSPTTISAIPTTSITTSSPEMPTSSSLSSSFSSTTATSTTSLLTTSSASVSSHLTSSSTSSSSILPTPTVTPAGNLSRGQLIGIIVAGILTLIFIFACLIFFWLCYKQRRNRNSRTRFSYITPIDEDYFVIGPGGRSPGEGSPRHSGEEADPFLQRSRGPIAGPSGTQTQEMTQVGPELGVRSPPRMPLPPTGSLSSSGSSSTGASGYGVLLDRPSLGLLPSTPEENVGEHEPLSSHDMQRIQNESVLPSDQDQPDEEYTGAYAYSNSPLLPPPRLVDPETAYRPMDPLRPPFKSSPSHLSHQSSYPLDAEEAVTLTARRVRVESVSPHYSPLSTGSPAGPSTSGSGLLDALRLSGLGRFSWFNTSSEPRHSTHSQDYTVEPFTDADFEQGRLRNPNLGQQQVGLGPDGVRPTSNISARSAASGGTVYHDAYSSAPSTPVLALPPRAVTPPEAPAGGEQSWMSGSSSAPPPAYEDPYSDPAPGGTSFSTQTGTGDILDTPAPPSAIPHFVSSTSLRDSNTTSSIALRNHPYPPGLALVSPKAWANSDLSSTASGSPVHLVSPHMDSPGGADVTIDIDILEEEPPNAGEGWRTMASGLFGPAGRRTTFGLPQYVYQPDFLSEQGSLHSMRSHMAPSSRSTGSASASRREMGGSFGSNSSRPSAYSAVSATHNSLSRQGSLGSDGFGRRRVGGPISPALSALGPMYRRSQWMAGSGSDSLSGSGSGGSGFGLASVVEQQQPAPAAMVGPPPSAHVSPDRSTIRTVTSGSATLRDDERRTTASPPLSPSFAPWAVGLDQDWTPA